MCGVAWAAVARSALFAPACRLVLASASPRRAELLGRLGLDFEVRPAEIDESVLVGESAVAYVGRLSAAKAAAVARPGELVIGADTIVALDGEIFGKPTDHADATRMLERLSGSSHHVHTGVTVGARSFVVSTAVRFAQLSAAEIAWYVGTGEPFGKAGAYAVQGAGGAFVQSIDGSFSNVIGLPLAEVLVVLREGQLHEGQPHQP